MRARARCSTRSAAWRPHRKSTRKRRRSRPTRWMRTPSRSTSVTIRADPTPVTPTPAGRAEPRHSSRRAESPFDHPSRARSRRGSRSASRCRRRASRPQPVQAQPCSPRTPRNRAAALPGPAGAGSARAAARSAGGWAPSHSVPPQGLRAWGAPDPSGPVVANLAPGLPIQVAEVRGAWARVICSNGWTGWIDGRIIGVAA